MRVAGEVGKGAHEPGDRAPAVGLGTCRRKAVRHSGLPGVGGELAFRRLEGDMHFVPALASSVTSDENCRM